MNRLPLQEKEGGEKFPPLEENPILSNPHLISKAKGESRKLLWGKKTIGDLLRGCALRFCDGENKDSMGLNTGSGREEGRKTRQLDKLAKKGKKKKGQVHVPRGTVAKGEARPRRQEEKTKLWPGGGKGKEKPFL